MGISEELFVTAAVEEVKELPIIYFKNIGKSKRKRERERERERKRTLLKYKFSQPNAYLL